jgi:hypothetical protein
LGIGTAAPQQRLHIAGDIIVTGSLGVNVAPNATDGRVDASNDIVAFSTSDIRLKTQITKIESSLERVNKLTGISFKWIQEPEIKKAHGYDDVYDLGVIAQEVAEVFPEAVRINKTGYFAVRYERLIPVLIEAIKELKTEVDELRRNK